MQPSLFPHTTTGFSYSVDLIPGDQPELIFGALNLSKRLHNRRFDDIVNSNILWIDGDDKHFSKEADVTVARLHGREFVYNKGDMSGRTLFLNGVNRVYFLIYSTESDAGSADVVNRIFSSFRPLRRGRRQSADLRPVFVELPQTRERECCRSVFGDCELDFMTCFVKTQGIPPTAVGGLLRSSLHTVQAREVSNSQRVL